MIAMTTDPIDVAAVLAAVQSDDCGAVDLFLGTVRNHNRGKAVVALAYEAYPEMAERTMTAIVAEARRRWDIRRAAVVHRYGDLAIGDVAVAVAVASPHRQDAFAATRFIIDRLKAEVPIWKKERGADGEVWLENHA